ncbi:Ig-like domain-containing protein [Soonwooa sp.]|uniref:Ig-like domain-containing protein n=1 Tax=Soonwooa sp. TaxID=1938592 RepID=UPI00260F7207|nr:Ig-like domain-containing protein [Soonwooa sp.]
MKRLIILVFVLCFANGFGQESKKIFTSDIDNFWLAYDNIQQAKTYNEKLNLINEFYIKKASKGLVAFMKARDYNDSLYVKLIDDYPKFWNSIRPNTLAIKDKTDQLSNAVSNLKKLYPELKDAEMYFTIGGLRSGGTVTDNMVLVGAEIATGTPNVDVSEFPNTWLKKVFERQTLDNIVYLNIHEYIHTQQVGGKSRLLNQSIKEGSCDFIAELALGKPIQTQYLDYGRSHLPEIKEAFKKEMFSNNLSNWLYNGQQKENADLGYFVGYQICKDYYDGLTDKAKAIKDIIRLNYSDNHAVEDFLYKSKFFNEKINKGKIIEDYKKQQPYVVGFEPFKNNSKIVDSTTKELRITFSKPMNPHAFSINYTKKGPDYYPITKVKGFENDDKTMVLVLDLKANKDYEFVITNNSFRSKDGYPLAKEEYLVKFKTN